MMAVQAKEAELANERQKVMQQAQIAQMQAAAVKAETQRLAQAAEVERQRLAALATQVCEISRLVYLPWK